MAPIPASIRYKNPGAMWGNALAIRWGAGKKAVGLNDGLNQGNNIAVFPDFVSGACAQFDLWRTKYCNMSLKAAILKWSGGNWSQPYADFLTKHTGLAMDTLVSPIMLSGPTGWQLMKYQAQWEAGQPYPMSDADWQLAQRKVFAPVVTRATKKTTVAAAVVVSTGTVAVQAVKQGHHWSVIIGILVAGVIAVAVSWIVIHKYHKGV